MKHDIDILLVQLRDGRATTRAEAAKTLSEYPSPLARDDLARLARDKDETARYWAVRALDALDDPGLVPALVERLKDPASGVRMAAVRALSRRAERAALGPVLESLADPDPDVVYWAVEAAVAYKGYAVPQLIARLAGPDWGAREAAAEALYRIGTEALGPLEAALGRDDDDVRFWALKVLGRLRAVATVDRVRAFLDSGRRDLAGAAMRALATMGDREALPRIVVFLGSPDPFLRAEAVEALASYGDFAVKLLADMLDGSRRVVRLAATEALGLSGDSALVPVLEKLKEDSAELRYWAVRALERFDRPVVVPLLVELLADESPDVQLAAAEALGRYPLGPELIPGVMGMLGTESWRVRQALAAAASAQKGWKAAALAPWLASEDEDVRFWTVKILGTMGDEGAIPLLMGVFEDPAWPIRKHAAEGLAGLGTRALPALREALVERAGDANQRYWLTRALVGIRDVELVGLLVGFLEDADPGVRGNAVEALVALGDPAVPRLIEQLRSVPSRPVREAISKVLVGMRTSRHSEIMELFDAADPDLVHWATWTMGQLGDLAVPALAERIDSGSERQRYQALKALAYVHHPRTVAICTRLLEDEFPSLRRVAIRTLGAMRIREAAPALLGLLAPGGEDMRIEILEALGRIGGDGALEAILTGLAADRWEVRRTAVVALKDLGDRRAAPALARLLAPAHRDLWGFLAEAIGALGGPEHVPALAKLMRTAEPRELAALVAAVGRLGGPAAEKVLEPLLRHPAWEIQEAAVEAYGGLGAGADPGPLKPLAGSGDPLLRARAREALRRVMGPEAWDRLLKGSMKKALDDPADAAFQEATEKLRGKDREGAKRLLRRALRIAKRSEYHALLGSLCMDAGERPEAERHLRRAVALAPQDPVPLVKLGVLQSMLGKHRPAAASLRRVLAMDDLPAPVRELAHRTLAKVHELMKAERAPSADER